MQQRTGKLDPAAVAAAELRRFVVGAVGKPEAGQFGFDPRLGDAARNAVQAGVKQQIGGDRQFEIEGRLLEHDADLRQRRYGVAAHVVAHHLDGPRIRDEQAGQQLKQRRFAGAVGPEQCDELSRTRRETDAVDRPNRPVALHHIV